MTIKNFINKKLKNENGTMYYEVIIQVVIVITLLLTSLSIFNIFIKYQSNNYIAKRIVRAIEIEGAVSAEVNTIFSELKGNTNLDNATYKIVDVNYFSGNKIQLRETFTVIVESEIFVEILDPLFAPPVRIPIKLTSSLTGMSEVYHKN